jgi:6-pyruvoyltetrahydropterin/6-carboxytetrahydropterin synthase
MREVGKIFSFSAAHKLPSHKGLCRRLHGHTYKLEVRVAGEPIGDPERPDFGMVIDFGELKRIVTEEILQFHDHAYLNKYYPNPTAELMVVRIAGCLETMLPNHIVLTMVKLWETETSYAIWKNPESI